MSNKPANPNLWICARFSANGRDDCAKLCHVGLSSTRSAPDLSRLFPLELRLKWTPALATSIVVNALFRPSFVCAPSKPYS